MCDLPDVCYMIVSPQSFLSFPSWLLNLIDTLFRGSLVLNADQFSGKLSSNVVAFSSN